MLSSPATGITRISVTMGEQVGVSILFCLIRLFSPYVQRYSVATEI